VVSVTAISIAAALYYERQRSRQARSLASVPGGTDILPALLTNAEMLLAALGRPVRPASSNRKP
jgi:hypothetical protein